MTIMPRIMVAGKKTITVTALEFPRKENILFFQGKSYDGAEKISKECEDICWVGNRLEKLGVD